VHDLFIVMLNFIMLSVIKLNVITCRSVCFSSKTKLLLVWTIVFLEFLGQYNMPLSNSPYKKLTHVFWPQSLDGSQQHHFANCWGSARNFKPTNQTSTNLLIKYHYNYSNYLIKNMIYFKLMTILSKSENEIIC
jgi:hypothetical protein